MQLYLPKPNGADIMTETAKTLHQRAIDNPDQTFRCGIEKCAYWRSAVECRVICNDDGSIKSTTYFIYGARKSAVQVNTFISFLSKGE